MFTAVRSLGLSGVTGYEVRVECDISAGLPRFDLVGLPDNAVKEARERVRSAIQNSGFLFGAHRITVNLAPADRRKEGSLYDLPILVGVLAASGQLPAPAEEMSFLGEVSLSGEIRPVRGVLPMAAAAREMGVRSLLVPADNAPEATLAGGLNVYPVENLRQLADHLFQRKRIAAASPWEPEAEAVPLPDFADVKGQEPVKRALEIAAAGGHHLLMVGSPGSGKSMLAHRMPSILPDMSREEALEVTQLWSVCGLLDNKHPLLTSRPFRAPHHTISSYALAGGGVYPRPRRDLSGPPRRPLPGRAAGVPDRRPGGAAPAPGGRGGANFPGLRLRDLPQPVPDDLRHEPLQVRLVRPPLRPLHLFPQERGPVPGPPARPPAGPH